MQLIELWTCQRSAKECESLLVAAGVPCTPYLTVEQAMQSDQAQARGACTCIADAAGSYWIPHAPFQMPGLDVAPRVKVRIAAVGWRVGHAASLAIRLHLASA